MLICFTLEEQHTENKTLLINSNLTFQKEVQKNPDFPEHSDNSLYVKITSSPTLSSKHPMTSSLMSSFQGHPPSGHMSSTSCQTTLLPICSQPLQERTGKIWVSHVFSFRTLLPPPFKLRFHFRSLDSNSYCCLPP